ncbi:alpha/beta fold hydrolase [Speluncibacter jeojiensis]|uniref:alpha/beta fold hydrolase n=1 Tax=Speluncibacter jeojiensis TaxID=2710754 RepID=UPI0039F5D592
MLVSEKRIDTFSRDGLTFDVRDTGPIDGVPVVLLHGFPQDSRSWDKVVPVLHAHGYRTLAPDQRGYSPGARPRRRRDYRGDELVADVAALIEQAGVGPVHLVGHDWGAAVTWMTAAARPELLRTMTAVSVPHVEAFVRAMLTSTQGLRSWYMFFFQLPWLPERVLTDPRLARRALRRTGQSEEGAARDAARMADPRTARGAVNWYRAMVLTTPDIVRSTVHVPALQVWSDHDTAIGPRGPALSPRFVEAPLACVTLPGVSHWIPDEAPDALAGLIVEHLRGHDRAGSAES